MSANTKIEWADHTFNPWIGCTKVSPACDHCYAERSTPARAMKVIWGAKEERHRTSAANWALPKRWNAQAEAFMAQHGRRQRVFCASLADVFDNAVNPAWRVDLWQLIQDTPNLDWLLLTKRVGNVFGMLPDGWAFQSAPWPNVWIGATVVNQDEADRDIPKLLAVPARVRFLSMEPLLGPVNLTCIDLDGHSEIFPLSGTTRCENEDGTAAPDLPAISWVIVGGESGPGARPMHPESVRSLRDQCDAAGVPFLFKQWGEWVPYEHGAQPPFLYSQHGHEIDGHTLPDFESGDYDPATSSWSMDWADMLLARKVGKKAAGRLLDGRMHDGFPS